MINDFQEEIAIRRLRLKKDIKKTGGNCARILLILSLCTYGIGGLIIFGIRFRAKQLGVAMTSNVEAENILGISKDAYNFMMGYLPCIIADIIAILIALKTTTIRIRKDMLCKIKSPKLFVLLGTVSCIGTGMISSIIYQIYSTLFNAGGITIPEPDFSMPTQTGYMILFLSYVCVVGPVLEEIIFRGFILKSMQKYGNLTAIIVSSILFSMFHLNLVQFVNPVLMGIVLGFIAIKSKSVVASIIAHIFNNTITFMLAGISLLKMPILEYSISTVYFLGGVVLFVLFVVRYSKDFIETIRENTNILKTYKKVVYAFSSGWARVYIVFYVLLVGGIMFLTNLFKIS